MKSLRKYGLMLTTIGLLLLTGCEKDFDKINTNPNNPTEASTPALFSQAVRNFAYNDFDVWYAARQSALACQQFAQRNYTSEDRYSYRVNVTDGFFRNNYIWMNNLQKIIELNTDPATKDNYQALYGDNNMQIAMAEIMKCWVFQLLTDYFGDIPYTQALNLDKYPQPAYDTQQAVYDGLIATLNDAQDKIVNSTTDGFATGDLLFNGDLSKWKKFANSLRLRIALRASGIDAKYVAEALDAIADGVMSSNADNAQCLFSTPGAPNEAPWYNGYFTSGRNDFTYTYRFLELLKGNNHLSFTNPFSGIFDPRYKVFTTYTTPDRLGVPYGMPDGITQKFWSKYSAKRVSLLARNPVIVHPDFPSTFLDYPTVCFMVCEVNGWDATWFQNGIEASLEMWGAVDPGNAYVNAIMAKFNDPATTTEMKKEMVITQKYIHLLMQPHEAWAEYRRTGYPKSIVKPGEVTFVDTEGMLGVAGVSYIFTPIAGSESGSDIVARFKYPSSEYTLNETNVSNAVRDMGEDSHKQRVWWAGGGSQ
ncbi:MAG TPA: SusD/RagB family nutrient-binding outer membrane lipoprotein [Tenuifilaceae bacterium]|nr:SusD/RagB family nutrient-binding outer membrane lipoprotein [Tenuifilaceae bacterium]